MEGVEKFKYLESPMDQMDCDWLEVCQNFKRERKVWGRLGKMIKIEEADIKVSEMLYRAVVQLVLLFGLESWVLLSEMNKTVEQAHTRFLRQIMGKQVQRNPDRTWVTL